MFPLMLLAEVADAAASTGLTADQITSISGSLTSTVNGVVSTFVSLVPIIALTTGAIFGIRFIKGRFKKVEKLG